MKVKVLKNTVMDGSVWFAGDVAEILEETAQAAIRRGDAAPVDEVDTFSAPGKKR